MMSVCLPNMNACPQRSWLFIVYHNKAWKPHVVTRSDVWTGFPSPRWHSIGIHLAWFVRFMPKSWLNRDETVSMLYKYMCRDHPFHLFSKAVVWIIFHPQMWGLVLLWGNKALKYRFQSAPNHEEGIRSSAI
jgi:hypothetical protein